MAIDVSRHLLDSLEEEDITAHERHRDCRTGFVYRELNHQSPMIQGGYEGLSGFMTMAQLVVLAKQIAR